MKKFAYLALASMFLLLAVSASLSVIGKHQDTPREAFKFADLTLTIATSKTDFVPLEPIPIILTLSNNTAQPILGHGALEFSRDYVDLFVGRSADDMQLFRNLSTVQVDGIIKPRRINPGESQQSLQMLTIKLDKMFPQPGTYRIQAVLHNIGRKEEVRSSLLSVRILSPKGRDLQAYEYLKSKAHASLFFSGLDNSGKGTEALEEFVAKFGDSAYGDHAAYLLGITYFYKKEYQKAKEQFSKLSAKSNFVFAKEASTFLDQTNSKLRAQE
jgi:hypothetical protein